MAARRRSTATSDQHGSFTRHDPQDEAPTQFQRTLASANAFLARYFAQHNACFAVTAAEPDEAHLPYAGKAEELARCCTMHDPMHDRRKRTKGLILSFGRQCHIVRMAGTPRHALRRGISSARSRPVFCAVLRATLQTKKNYSNLFREIIDGVDHDS
ncbi:hypothetical protein [Tepidiphilus olei]|uniref:hypothetical protein n=1 Tax=Tepidiphilus olei TaxID=2502184 RepID=UPI00115E51BD|nr:hypothetical protein [Tepidiphilus olei]